VDTRARQFGERHDQVIGDSPKLDTSRHDPESKQRQPDRNRRHRQFLPLCPRYPAI
jgi:hypothetical protein